MPLSPSAVPPAVLAERLGVALAAGTLLRPVDLRLDRGEILAVEGANGSGKTTLLRAVAGLIAPSEGSVHVLGLPPDDRDPRVRRGLAALIGPPQTARDLTLAEHLRFVSATWGASGGLARSTADGLLAELDIARLADRYPHELSSGQAQLMALALLLARPAEVLVLDEPEQRLDDDRLGLAAAALRRRADAGCAVLLATHSPRLLESLADRRLRLEEAR
ncbi:ABC transporter ATP-binding protein [Brachybacterium sp. DNPG3]